MDRKNWYFKEKVCESDMDQIHTDTETEFEKFMGNLWRQNYGITNYAQGGGSLEVDGVNSKTIKFTKYATFGRATGKFINIPVNTTYELPDSLWTPILTYGQARMLRIMCKHEYSPSVPEIDGYGDTQYTRYTDSYVIEIIASDVQDIADKTVPAHPLDGRISLGVCQIGYSDAAKTHKIIIGGINCQHQPGNNNTAQDRLDALGLQSPYWGSVTSIVQFSMPMKEKNPLLVPDYYTRTYTHGLGIGRCSYVFSIYANESGPTVQPIQYPVFFQMGVPIDVLPIRIYDLDTLGKVYLEFKHTLYPAAFEGQMAEVFCIKLH